MKATYWQRGETLDFTPAEQISNGAVVPMGSRIGVACGDIPAGEPGQIHVVGVFVMDKAGAEAIPLGASVYYDAAGDVITAAAEGHIPAGYAAAEAAAADSVVLVKLLG